MATSDTGGQWPEVNKDHLAERGNAVRELRGVRWVLRPETDLASRSVVPDLTAGGRAVWPSMPSDL